MAPSFLLLHVITNEKSLKFTQIGRLLSASRASPQKHVPTTLVSIPVDIYTLRTSLIPRSSTALARRRRSPTILRRSALLSLSLIGDTAAITRSAKIAAVWRCLRSWRCSGVPTIKVESRPHEEPAAKVKQCNSVGLVKLATMLLLHTSMRSHNTPQLPATNRVKQNQHRMCYTTVLQIMTGAGPYHCT